jgi:signal transduction histidine kinase
MTPGFGKRHAAAWIAMGALAALTGGLALARAAASRARAELASPDYALRVLARIRAETPALGTFDLAGLPQARYGDELIDPRAALPVAYQFDPADLRALAAYTRDCQGQLAVSAALRKAAEWARVGCTAAGSPPRAFFARAPFMHPSGHSYVALAVRRGWVDASRAAELAPYAHVLESAELAAAGWPAALAFTPGELDALYRGLAVVSTPSRVYLRDPNGAATYRILPRVAWDRLLARAALTQAGDGWHVDTTAAGARVVARTQELRAAAVGLGVAFGLVLAQTLGLALRERAARAFMLQVLTHELRTPAAGLRLTIETFRGRYGALPDDLQDAFLCLCDDVQRLSRVINASKSYLLASGKSGSVALAAQKIESVNDFVAQVLEPHGTGVELAPLAVDCAARTDPYWLGVCISNLAQNAQKHGRGRVQVRLERDGSQLAIAVADEGRLTSRRLRARSHGGMGLGLGITRTLIARLGGRLIVTPNPTTFTLQLELAP